ncbi:MAG: type II toxin-antitoxin system VapC family toxin [Candidatus Levyibacteriota bacterium]
MVIVDTSVVYKWFSKQNEQDREKALQILQAHLEKKEVIHVPSLILFELANVWATKTYLSLPKIKVFMKDLEQVNLTIIPVTFALLNQSIKFSKKYKVSVYDAIYAVLAQEKHCILVTADTKFVEKVALSYVKKLQDF